MTEDTWADGLCFAPMTVETATTIADTWAYPAPYDFYDMAADPEDYAEFITPEDWPTHFWQVTRAGQLVGFFGAEPDGERGREISLGLRPDLTGAGRGSAFLRACLETLLRRAPTGTVKVQVAAFNRRAMSVYASVGFRVTRRFPQATNGGVHDFVEMKLSPAGSGDVSGSG